MAKNRADSAHIISEITTAATKRIEPPECVKLDEEHIPFWDIITKPRHEWTDIDLVHAANLARCLYSIEENTRLLKLEGDVVENARGTQVMNPRFSALEQLSRRSVALSQKLQIHALATMGNPRDNRKKNAVKRNAIEAFGVDKDEDDLIARPIH